MDKNINLTGYLNRHDAAKQFDTVLYRADHVIQSDELNETQSLLQARVKGVADVLLADGAVIRDARIVVNAITGATTCESGALYVDGAVRGIPPAMLAIAVVGIVIVGVYLQPHIITELEDPTLRNRAQNTRGFDKAGAGRLQKLLAWGFAGDGQTGDFYPVYTVEDGTVRSKEPPPQLDGVTQALARYDRDSSGGSYVVNGLNVTAANDMPSGEQVYTVSEGRARVTGFAVELPTSRRLVRAATPDLRFIENEPHQSTGPAAQRVNFDRAPAANVTHVTITAQKTIDVAHGGFTGALDPLEDGSVLVVLSVKQGATTYTKDVDWKFTAQQIDWSLPGAEPQPGSTYKVTYQYLATVPATAIDADGCTVTNAVAGTAILISYNRMLPRIDRLCMDSAGALVWLPGVAADRNPRPPSVPANLLPLASVLQNWRAGSRTVMIDSVRTVPMETLAVYSKRLDMLTELVAQQRLESSTQLRDATAKRGLLVDPFISDSVRDQGLPQTAAIFGGELTLPVSVQPNLLSISLAAPQTLPFNPVTLLEQPWRTGSMKINPYDAFDPLPSDVTLTPAIDRWTDVDTQWNSPTTETITENITRRVGLWIVENGEAYDTTNQITRDISHTSKAAEYIRQINVAFTVKGFEAGETIQSLRFDGIAVVPDNLATPTPGTITGTFTVPAKVPAGSKRVEFVGNHGSFGVAIYSGTGVEIQDVKQLVTVHASGWVTFLKADPLAQTFTLAADRQIAGLDLWFTAKGNSLLAVQIRETSTGIPNQKVIAQARISAAAINVDGQATRISFDYPVSLTGSVDYALVILCDDATTAASIAELGKYDDHKGQWVASQPYTVGVLLSSSNATTWTPHQDRDLAFRLLAAEFTATTRTIALGNANLANVTDLMLLSLVETPSAQTRVEYQITLPGGSVMNVDDGQPVRLAAPMTGQFSVTAKLTGTANLSPVLHPGITLLAGTVSNQGNYISPLVPAGQNVRARIVVDCYLPAGAALAVSVAPEAAGAPVYTVAPFVSSRDIAADWHELTYELNGVTADRLRSKLELSGNTAARPRHRNLRVIVI
ncbi:DUF4815 domain-containing protein [Undibacterium sp. Ji42W]|uniref:DUF4815 domain-containing protein n=1 Tax=Undibacterium sp. Ji42W TaxID=3413039 RepID=UPI003BF3CDEB